MAYRIPHRVACVVTDNTTGESDADALRVSLLRLPDGAPVVLTGAAALIWLVAAEGSTDIVADVALGAAQPPDLIRDDVESFVVDLEAQGLIEPAEGRANLDRGNR